VLKQAKGHIIDSFGLWADHILCNKGRAFTNWSGLFYKERNGKTDSLNTYFSQFRQFVYDQSVSGANIPSGIYVNNNFVSRGTSGLAIDYDNGAVWFNGGASLSNLQNVSGNYAVKEFNIYLTSKSEGTLIYETKYEMKPKYLQASTGLAPNKYVAPCIFIINNESYNSPENLGGESYRKNVNIRAIVLSSDENDLINVASFFEDRAFSNFAILDSTPLNRLGDYQTGGYNYVQAVQGRPLAYIQNVYYTKFDPDAENSLSDALKVGFLEFEIEYSVTRDRSI
jgi:hypothetical protein